MPGSAPIVAFVGTFDGRKGAREFPDLVRWVARDVPGVTFMLLGTGGQSPRDVLRHFPGDLHPRLEIRCRFAPDELPGLLARCAVGVFPSRVEGFGFGVLEMLAAGLPVLAYRAPGPPMMLPDEYLVPVGDARGLARKVVALLHDEASRVRAARWARERARAFRWRNFAEMTSREYLVRLAALRARSEFAG
jgi:glycosyltransferase involved in cell wall biosynthesis